MSDVVIVGSINIDYRVVVEKFPGPGQTILAFEHSTSPGGKGANQAVAAARAGAHVRLVGCVGADPAGRQLLDALSAAGVETSSVSVVDEPTGAAYVTVDLAGQNQIIVAPGANSALSPEVATEQLRKLAPGDIVALQLEVPLPLVGAVIDQAHQRQATVMVNVSPVPDDITFLEAVDVLVVNEVELSQIARMLDLVPCVDLQAAARKVAERLGNLVICTAGEAGALAATTKEQFSVVAPKVIAVDTTGAGDTFAGYLAAALAEGVSLRQAMKQAVQAASVSVTRPGAIDSIPTLAEVTLT